MTAPPTVVWFTPSGLRELERWVASGLAREQQEPFWALVAPALGAPPATSDADWLARVVTLLEQDSPLSPGQVEACRRVLERAVAETRWERLKKALARELRPPAATVTDDEALALLADLAGKVRAAGSPQDRRDLQDNAAAVLEAAFTRFDATRPFNPWAYAVLRNHAVTLGRRRAREARLADVAHAAAPGCAAEGEGRAAELAEALRRARACLDRAVFFPKQADGIDGYAIFVLELRLRWAEKIGLLTTAGDEPCRDGSVGYFIDQLLPWQEWERPRRVKLGWPTLDALWQRLCGEGQVPTPDGLHRADVILAACEHLVPELRGKLLVGTWHKWVERAAKREMRPHLERVDPGAWAAYFERFFFDRRRRGNEATG